MFRLFGAAPVAKNVLLIDIGSASVGAGLARITREGTPTLLINYRAPIKAYGPLSSARLADATIMALRDAASRVARSASLYAEGGRIAPQRIDEILCMCASPWHFPKPKLLRLNRETPFALSRALVARMAREEAARALADASRSAERGMSEFALAERLILTVALNGYETTDIYAGGVKSAELSLYMSFIPAAFASRIRHELEKLLTDRPLSFHSFPLMFYLAARALSPRLSRSLLVDIAGEMTDVTLVEGGMIRGISSFPHGKHALRRLLPVSSEEEGETALRLAAKAPQPHLRRAIDAGLSTWSARFSVAVQALLQGAMPPRFVYAIADEHVLPLYVSAIEQEPLSSIVAGGVQALGVSAALLAERCRLGSATASPDAFLMLGAVVADALHDRSVPLDFLSTNLLLEERAGA